MSTSDTPQVAPNFITDIIEKDLQGGLNEVVTRFPPEPNGYLHLGHTFASFLDFQTAAQYGGRYHLRLDDTNPEGESMEYAQSIQDDLRWLGWNWGDNLYFASDNFERYYELAQELIRRGKAYVDSVSAEEMARLRGTATQAGRPSPYRERSMAENLDLFARMRSGEFADGEHVLRAKIDLSSPNMKLRDPVLYRILRAEHYRQGSAWCIYPMYDFQHPLQDALEGVTHSMCSLEFVDNRAIYDWLMETLEFSPRPHQYEFGRRSLEYTVVSKRKLRQLVAGGHVEGWDDPRMPTLRAARRLGVTPQAIKNFAAAIGVSRTNRTVDIAVYENAVRDDLNYRSPRVMAVLDPIKVVISGAQPQTLRLPYWPHDVMAASPDGLLSLPSGQRVSPEEATREVPFGPEIYIEREDVRLTAPKGFKRLVKGGAVRLRGAGIIRADDIETDAQGRITLVRASLLGEDAGAKGVIHWVEAQSAVPAEFRLYERLFRVPHPEGQNPDDILPEFDPEEPGHEDNSQPLNTDFLRYLNPDSLVMKRGVVEQSVLQDPQDTRYQFERQGYFWRDPKLSREDGLVFGRIISLKDTWGAPKEEGKGGKGSAAPKKAAPSAAPKAPQLSAEEEASASVWRARGVAETEARQLARQPELAQYLSGVESELPQVASWAVQELAASIRAGTVKVSAQQLSELAAVLRAGQISSRIAREALQEAAQSGEAPLSIVERRGPLLSDEAELGRLVAEVLRAHPDKLAEYRGGRSGLLGFFTGQAMRASQGRADPQALAKVLNAQLRGEPQAD